MSEVGSCLVGKCLVGKRLVGKYPGILQNEVGATRQTVGNVVEGIGSMTRKRKAPASNPPKKKKVKRVNVRKFASKNATRGFTSYTDDKAAQNDFFNQS